MKPLLFASIFGLACYTLAMPCGSAQEHRPYLAQNSDLNASTINPAPAKKPYPYAPTRKTKPKPVSPPPPVETPRSFRVTAKHRESNGIGYNQGYSSLDGFFLLDNYGKWFPFFDVRAHVFNNGKAAANLGFGIRFLPDTVHAVFGANAFVDMRATSHSSFQQLGCGLEFLGTKWTMRGNGYFPLFHRNHLYEEGFGFFRGNQAVFQAKHDLAFKGFDLSLGRLLLRSKECDLSSVLGGYMFFADYATRASGGLLKFTSRLTPYVSLEVQGSYDNLFKGIAQAQIALNLPFGKRIKRGKSSRLSKSQEIGLTRRLAEEVDRFEIIVTEKHIVDYVGEDPRTGAPLTIVFVDNTAPLGGNGTAESPYNALTDGEANSNPWDMIYVYGGDGSPLYMSNGITLQSGQWLQGSANSFSLNTTFGPCNVPKQTIIRPSILSTTGDTVILSRDTIVSGFDIRSLSGANIRGGTLENVTISQNHLIRSGTFDILLLDVGGSVVISNNQSLSDQGLYFHSGIDASVLIENNLFANTGLKNLDIEISESATSTLSIVSGNIFNGSGGGSTILFKDRSSVNLSLEDSVFTGIQSSAVVSMAIQTIADATATVLCRNNSFDSEAPGLSLTTDLLGTATWFVVNNVGHYSGTSSPLYPFNFATASISTATLYLVDNFASNNGYLLASESTSSFTAAALHGSEAGLETLNTGSFTINGTINYIPFFPSLIPD